MENEIIYDVFEKVKDIPLGKERSMEHATEVTKWLVHMKEKTADKIDKNRIRSEVGRLQKEYDKELIQQGIRENIYHFRQYRFAVRKSIVQWNMGLYRDQTRENILEWVSYMINSIYNWAHCVLDNESYKKLDTKSRTYITSYPYDIIQTLDQPYFTEFKSKSYKFQNTYRTIYIYDKKDFKTFNKLLSTTKGVYDAIEILIGKKPIEKVIKEVREVILTVHEKPKPQPESTKFICFNCDKEYDKPITICEKCGFVFKKTQL